MIVVVALVVIFAAFAAVAVRGDGLGFDLKRYLFMTTMLLVLVLFVVPNLP
ncbi:MAG: hypothetical protein JWR83_2047 [Aeromicrobium sp.]|nr:hypothetical protein [Aeromicrobium sp.]